MNSKIINNFHLLYESTINNDIETYIYLSILSIIKINNPHIIYFYYYNIPNGNLWNKIKDKLTLKKIDIPKIYENNIDVFFKKYRYIIIYKELIENGGVYINLNTLSIRPIKELLQNSFIKSNNNEIIACEKKSKIAYDFYKYYISNKDINHDIDHDNNFSNNIASHKDIKILDDNFKYDNRINDIIFKEIYDYSFSLLFHLFKNNYFISLGDNNLDKINLYDVFNKITVYNLLVKKILVYNFINNDILLINNNNYQLINNIDKIYWINLEESVNRKTNMINILKNFNIENIKINAVNGDLEKDINKKYFYSTDDNYPNYSNKEYAILLSHLNTIETYINIPISELRYGYAIIMEDDISLDFINYWNKDLKNIIEDAPNDWDIIMLGYFSLKNNNIMYKKWDNEWSAISYLINHKSSQKINNLKIDQKWKCSSYDVMVSDNYIFSKLNTYVYKYPYFTFPNNNDSTFHEDHLEYHKLYKISNYITLNNIYNEYICE